MYIDKILDNIDDITPKTRSKNIAISFFPVEMPQSGKVSFLYFFFEKSYIENSGLYLSLKKTNRIM